MENLIINEKNMFKENFLELVLNNDPSAIFEKVKQKDTMSKFGLSLVSFIYKK